MYKLLILLPLISMSMTSQAANNCFPETIIGEMDLMRPWPLQAHGDRHTQIQQAISSSIDKVRYCLGGLENLSPSIQFFIPANGRLQIGETSIKSTAAECIANVLRDVRVGYYYCDMNVPYTWNGTFPLGNNTIGFHYVSRYSGDGLVRSPVRGIVLATGFAQICKAGSASQTATVKYITIEGENGFKFRILGVDQIYSELGAHVSTADVIGSELVRSGAATRVQLEIRDISGQVISTPSICSQN